MYLLGGISALDGRLGAIFICDPRKVRWLKLNWKIEGYVIVYVHVHTMLKICTCTCTHTYIICINMYHNRYAYDSLVWRVVTNRSPKVYYVPTTTWPWFQISTLNAVCFFVSFLSSSTLVNSVWGQIFNFAFEILHFAWTVWHLPPSFEWFAQYLVFFFSSCFSSLTGRVKNLKKPMVWSYDRPFSMLNSFLAYWKLIGDSESSQVSLVPEVFGVWKLTFCPRVATQL